MTDTPQLPETVEETLVLLRRFAGMLSGSNSDNLFRAVFLIEDLSHDLRVMSEAFEAERKNHAEDLDRCNTAESQVAEITARMHELTLQLDAERIQAQTAQEHLTEEKKKFEDEATRATRELDKLSAERRQGVLIPQTQLNLAITQFKAMAQEFRRKGDIASQVMCEIGYRAIEQKAPADADAKPKPADPPPAAPASPLASPPANPPAGPPPLPTSSR